MASEILVSFARFAAHNQMAREMAAGFSEYIQHHGMPDWNSQFHNNDAATDSGADFWLMTTAVFHGGLNLRLALDVFAVGEYDVCIPYSNHPYSLSRWNCNVVSIFQIHRTHFEYLI